MYWVVWVSHLSTQAKHIIQIAWQPTAHPHAHDFSLLIPAFIYLTYLHQQDHTETRTTGLSPSKLSDPKEDRLRSLSLNERIRMKSAYGDRWPLVEWVCQERKLVGHLEIHVQCGHCSMQSEHSVS